MKSVMTKGDGTPGPVAVLNVEAVLKISDLATTAREHLVAVRKSLEAGVKEIDAVYGKTGTHPSEATWQQGILRLNQQYQAEELHVNKVVGEMLTVTARAWAEEHPGTVVLPASSTLAAGKDTDITGEIITRMDALKPQFGDIPKVSVTVPGEQADKEARDNKNTNPAKPAKSTKGQ